MQPRVFDVIIIGGGPAAVHAATPLVEERLNVGMLDGGMTGEDKLEEFFSESFEEIRKRRPDQFRLFLGEDLSGIPVLENNASHSNMMTTGSREYVSKNIEEFLPTKSEKVQIIQSLAKGGLAEAWGGACDIFNEAELKAVGIPTEKTREYYQKIVDRIGISGESETYKFQPPIQLDHNGESILKRYEKIKKHSEFIIKKPVLALLTENLGDRKATNYHDTEYWLNQGFSVYRPSRTIDELRKNPNFAYLPGNVALTVNRTPEMNLIKTISISNKKEMYFKAKVVVLAAGSLNTSRILLRSFNLYDIPTAFIVKTNLLVPCINLSALGKAGQKKRSSLAQLFMIDKKSIGGMTRSFSQFYSYKSLLFFKLIPYSPLPVPETLNLLGLFSQSIVIVDVRFPSFLDLKNTIVLKKSSANNDYILINNIKKRENHQIVVKKIMKYLFSLGLIPLKIVSTPEGSTAHYASGIPFIKQGERHPLNSDANGRLLENNRIYIADASTWRALPAKPPALTIMMNAYRVGVGIANNLKRRGNSLIHNGSSGL
jgi:hypothetical protein